MNDKTSLFGYRHGTTPLHRLPAHIKLAALIPCTAAVFVLPVPMLAGASAVMVLLALTARIPFGVFVRNIRIIFLYGLLVVLFRFAGKPLDGRVWLAEAAESALYLWRLFLVMLTGTLFYETTSTLAIRHALGDFQRVLYGFTERTVRITGKRIDISGLPDVAFLLSLTITFIPRIFDSWAHLNDAWDARGGSAHRGPLAAFRRMTVLVPLLLSKLLALAADTDRAIRSRSS